jgi:hypothetical protein
MIIISENVFRNNSNFGALIFASVEDFEIVGIAIMEN